MRCTPTLRWLIVSTLPLRLSPSSQPATGLSALSPAQRAGAQRLCALARNGPVGPVLRSPPKRGPGLGLRLLHLSPHALAPVADLPVLEIVSAIHILADLTLGLGRVVHDYLLLSTRQEPRINRMALGNLIKPPAEDGLCKGTRSCLIISVPGPTEFHPCLSKATVLCRHSWKDSFNQS